MTMSTNKYICRTANPKIVFFARSAIIKFEATFAAATQTKREGQERTNFSRRNVLKSVIHFEWKRQRENSFLWISNDTNAT